MKDKVISLAQAANMITDGACIMVGGFIGVGTPDYMTDELTRRGVKEITLISNDASFPDKGVGKMVGNKQIKRFIGTHIGTNPDAGKRMSAGELDVTFIPQGTMVEQMRAKGAGLGAVLTQTGLGTPVSEGKQTIILEGKEYLVELPLGGEIAIIYGSVVDRSGNVYCKGTTKNFNTVMATAAKTVIVEAQKLVEVGEIDPDHIDIPGVYIDYIVEVK